MHQEGVSIQEAMAGEMVKMVVIASTTNQGEMVTIDRANAKRGHIQVTIYQEMGRIRLSPLSTN
jgi:uncharacterized protein (DUF2141 family)